MKKTVAFLSLISLFISCNRPPKEVGEFLYMEGDFVHSYKDCKVAEETTITRSSNLFQNTHKHNGKYYRIAESKNFWEVSFCSSCISESMMIAIEDSIAKYDTTYE